MDWDQNGYITPVEFKSYLEGLKKGEVIDTDEILASFNEIDTDGSKCIQWEEFLVRKRKKKKKRDLRFFAKGVREKTE